MKQARTHLNEIEPILKKGRLGGRDYKKVEDAIKTFEKLEGDSASSPEKMLLLKRINDLSYEYLQKRGWFACCGILNYFGDSYYKQLSTRISSEKDNSRFNAICTAAWALNHRPSSPMCGD